MRSGWITGLFLSRNFVKFFRAAIPLKIYRQVSEPVIHKYSEEKMFWNSCKCSTFSTVELFCRSQLATLWKKRLWHKCFPANFPKFLRLFSLETVHKVCRKGGAEGFLRRLLNIWSIYWWAMKYFRKFLMGHKKFF